MSVFRNPEVKKTVLFSLTVSILLAITGFFINIECGILIIVTLVILNTIYMVNLSKRYKTLAEYSHKLNSVLYDLEHINLDDYSEGELSILNNEMQKLVFRLRDDAQILKKDKEYLADSVADLSHQLRTPLTSISLISSFLTEEEMSTYRRFALASQLQMLINRITWQIDALLKISKLDAGIVSFTTEQIEVSTLIKKSLEPILIPLELRGIELNIKNNNAEFSGDLQWTSEALGNILKNCMEHCENDGVISVSYSENTLFTEIIITDNGCGFDDSDISHLFERFYQGKNASENSYGIGLALAKMIISRQNGTIKAENRRGTHGAKFYIRFYKGTV